MESFLCCYFLKMRFNNRARFTFSGLSKVQSAGLKPAESWILHASKLPLKALQEDQGTAATTGIRTSFTSAQQVRIILRTNCKFFLKISRTSTNFHCRYSDILSCIETRLSMLSMTYQKFIANGSSCFIPGKVSHCAIWLVLQTYLIDKYMFTAF